MGLQGARLVAGKIRSPPVPGCTACLGILAESCKRADLTLSRSAEAASDTSTRGENTGEMRDEGGRKGGETLPVTASPRALQAARRKCGSSIVKFAGVVHLATSGSGNFDCYYNETPPRGTTEVIGPRPSFRFVERSVRRRYGNSLMCEDGDKIESR